ncbi:MAG: hypothetical protein HYY18_22050 [Planctomycetes bacterium]|nr:hypothetical protein [Planctomycetota bacterium]
MAALGVLFIVAGLIVAAWGNIWFLVIAFKESALWGLGCLIVPFVSLIYLVMRWQECWRAFALNAVGIAVFFGGMVMLGASEAADAAQMPMEEPPPVEVTQ